MFNESLYTNPLTSSIHFYVNNNDLIDCKKQSFKERFKKVFFSNSDLLILHKKLKEIVQSISKDPDAFIAEVKDSTRLNNLKLNLKLINKYFERANPTFVKKIIIIFINFLRSLVRMTPIVPQSFSTIDWPKNLLIVLENKDNSPNKLSPHIDKAPIVPVVSLTREQRICQEANSKSVENHPIRFKTNFNDNDPEYMVMITPEKKIYIQKNEIAKGSSKKIYLFEEYNSKGEKQGDLAGMIIINDELGVGLHEIEKEKLLSTEINSQHLIPLKELMRFKENNKDEEIIYLSPLYEGKISNFRDSLNFREKLVVFIDIVRGIHDMHEKGYLHCDIHFGNLLIKDKRGAVIDLGAAKRMNAKLGNKSIPISTKDNIYGTIQAPECAQQGQTTAGDVYALGMVLRGFFKKGEDPLVERLLDFADDKPFSKGMQVRDPAQRPTISQVLEKLLEIQAEDRKQIQNFEKTPTVLGHAIN